jgi:hypothetical protein
MAAQSDFSPTLSKKALNSNCFHTNNHSYAAQVIAPISISAF